MKRMTEPELMEDALQVIAYAQADFSRSDDAFVRRLSNYLLSQDKNLNPQSLIIDFGCGPGNITSRLALNWPEAKVLGVDGSDEMIKVARESQRNNFSRLPGLSYENININQWAESPCNSDLLAEVLVSNSLLHHLHSPCRFWDLLKKLSAPGAIVMCRDLRRPESLEKALVLQKRYLPEAPEVLKKDFIASLKAAFTVDEIKKQLSKSGLCGFNVSEIDDRYLEVIGTISSINGQS